MPELSATTIEIVKKTAPVLAEHGTTITTTMYKNMFKNHPELKTLFNQMHQKPMNGEKYAAQPKSLAQAVHAYAANIDNLSVLGPAIERIAEKHFGTDVLPEHYKIVGGELIGALKEVLGAAATDDIVKAWTEAYGFLADIFITVEKKKREERAAQPGGWEGFKEFTITKKVKEADKVISFSLIPKDGSPLPTWKPGQHVGIRLKTKDNEEVQRMYSVSNSPSDSLRITVKDITHDEKKALVSSHLHSMEEGETVRITMPCGDVFISNDDSAAGPVTVLGLGIGVTPLAPIARAAAANGRSVQMVIGGKDEDNLALQRDFESVANDFENASMQVYFKHPKSGFDGHALSFDFIWSKVNQDSDFYMCGPVSWMEELAKGFSANGVPSSKVHFEFFGPTLQL